MPFVLNDDNFTNTYGFSILTSGIGLDTFRVNPVMLEGHINETDYTIGRWANIQVEESRLLAEPEFDEEDTDRAVKVKSKVDRGFIKAASIGITFDPDKLMLVDGRLILTACRLLEASIVPVPSNSGAVRLFSPDGNPLEDATVREMCLQAQNSQNPKIDKMKKFQISLAALAALGFNDAEQLEDSQLSAKIEGLVTANASLSARLKEMNDAAEAQLTAKRTAMIDLAIKEGRITADKRDSFLNLAKADFALAESTLEALPKKQSYAGTERPEGAEAMTMEKFQKLSVAEQIAFKTGQSELYKQLIKK